MKWPIGRYNGQKIVGFLVKFKLVVDFWSLCAGWNFGEPYLHIGPLHFWFGAEYRRTMHK